MVVGLLYGLVWLCVGLGLSSVFVDLKRGNGRDGDETLELKWVRR